MLDVVDDVAMDFWFFLLWMPRLVAMATIVVAMNTVHVIGCFNFLEGGLV